MDGESNLLLKWQASLGKEGTCIWGTSSEPFARDIESRKKGDLKSKAKIACFDLDGCIINPKNGKVRSKKNRRVKFSMLIIFYLVFPISI